MLSSSVLCLSWMLGSAKFKLLKIKKFKIKVPVQAAQSIHNSQYLPLHHTEPELPN